MIPFMTLLPDPSLLQYFSKNVCFLLFSSDAFFCANLLVNSAIQSGAQYKAIRVWKKTIKGHKNHKEVEHCEKSLGKSDNFYQ